MTEKVKKYISDILIAIKLIEEFSENITSFDDYVADLKTQSAIERKLEIIGEALNNIRKENSEISVSNDKEIIGFRNRLAHAYDSIDNAIVWAVLKRHIPKLKSEINHLIESKS